MDRSPEPEYVNLSRSPGIDSQSGGPLQQLFLTYWLARQHTVGWQNRLESISGLLKSLQIRALVPHGNRNTNLIRMTTHVF
jgi:hypothetical protein